MAGDDLYMVAFGELEDYLSSYSMKAVDSKPEMRAIARPAFKKFYPILLLNKYVSDVEIWNQRDKSTNFETYLREVVSDILQAFVLGSQGFYKPSYLILRSGLENFIRCIGISQDQSVLSLTSVFELIKVAKDTPFVNSNAHLKKAFAELQSEYVALCQHVHTATTSHMAHTSFVGVYPRFVKVDAVKLYESISRTSANILKILTWVLRAHLKKMHHMHYDTVCDALPKKFKQAINA